MNWAEALVWVVAICVAENLVSNILKAWRGTR